MTIHTPPPSDPVEFTVRLLKGRRLNELYGEVMDTVERCAAYLDGDGRVARAALPVAEQADFARMSMWLTASLMRSASIVLVLRSVGSGEMGVEAALRELQPTRKAAFDSAPPDFPGMPADLSRLREESVRAKEALERFVAILSGDLPARAGSPARRQIRELGERLAAGPARA